MDTEKIGSLIYSLRKEKGMTQAELAQQLHITDKTVSKWERGKGAPDVSLLSDVSAVFQVNLEKLLAGELEVNQPVIGNMRKLRFYVCPICGNLLFSVDEAAMYCCGKKVNALKPKKAEEYEKLTVEIIENEYCISSAHEMQKSHYISFVAFLNGDTVVIRKQYPEWNLQTRLPFFAHGTLLWCCTRHGLFYQTV